MTQDNDMEALKPCPFCGDQHHHVWIDKAERHAVLSNPSARGEL